MLAAAITRRRPCGRLLELDEPLELDELPELEEPLLDPKDEPLLEPGELLALGELLELGELPLGLELLEGLGVLLRDGLLDDDGRLGEPEEPLLGAENELLDEEGRLLLLPDDGVPGREDELPDDGGPTTGGAEQGWGAHGAAQGGG